MLVVQCQLVKNMELALNGAGAPGSVDPYVSCQSGSPLHTGSGALHQCHNVGRHGRANAQRRSPNSGPSDFGPWF